jgi:predicted GIY-YIG superfamily endonuclease
MYHVYLLQAVDCNKTYIGMTDDPLRRLNQHNRMLTGGARATAGHTWIHVLVLSGFPTRRDALQFEWYWKFLARRRRGIESKIDAFVQIWKRGYSSSTSAHFNTFTNPFFISYTSEVASTCVKKIECCNFISTDFKISSYISLQLIPFSDMSSSSYYAPRNNVIVDGVMIIPSTQQKSMHVAAEGKTYELFSYKSSDGKKSIVDVPKNVHTMVIPGLKQLAKAIGLKGISKLNKAALVELVSSHVRFE